MLSTPASIATPGQSTSSGIAARAIVVDLHLHQWGAKKHDKGITKEVTQQHGADEEMGNFTKLLLSPDFEPLKKMRALCARWSAEHRSRTVRWAESGERLLSSVGYFEYVSMTNGYRDEHEPLKRAIIDEMESAITEAQRRLGTMFNPGDYPTRRALERKFRVDVEFLPFTDVHDIRIEIGDAELARVTAEAEAAIQARLEKGVIETAQRLMKPVQRMVEQLVSLGPDEKGSFQNTITENVSAIIDLLPALNITGSTLLTDAADRMRADLLKYSAQTLRDSHPARVEVKTAADEILKMVQAFAA